jgi:hypothetical protein
MHKSSWFLREKDQAHPAWELPSLSHVVRTMVWSNCRKLGIGVPMSWKGITGEGVTVQKYSTSAAT